MSKSCPACTCRLEGHTRGQALGGALGSPGKRGSCLLPPARRDPHCATTSQKDSAGGRLWKVTFSQTHHFTVLGLLKYPCLNLTPLAPFSPIFSKLKKKKKRKKQSSSTVGIRCPTQALEPGSRGHIFILQPNRLWPFLDVSQIVIGCW